MSQILIRIYTMPVVFVNCKAGKRVMLKSQSLEHFGTGGDEKGNKDRKRKGGRI